MRTSSRHPSSNSWLPTEETARFIAFIDSIVGSSWNRPERSGEAPIKSPAATMIELGFLLTAFFRWVARYSAPPLSVEPMSAPVPEGGSRLPWKSLMARSCTLTEPRRPGAGSCVCWGVSTTGAESSTTRAQIRTIIRVYVSVAPVCNAFGIVSRGAKGMRPKLILIAGTLLLGVSIAVHLHAQRGPQSPSTPVALTPRDYLDIQQLVAEYAWAID